MIKTTIENEIKKLLPEASHGLFVVEKSNNFGDYSTNAALACAKELGKSPRELADEMVSSLKSSKTLAKIISKIEIAEPGFVNFYVKNKAKHLHIKEIVNDGAEYGKNQLFSGKKIIIEYTDPNPFKEFHIGHLMSNAIGESLSRIYSACGAEVKRACYQGDVGMHVAKCVWGIKNQKSKIKNAAELGAAYAAGAQAYENDPLAKNEIQEINKKIYDKSDAQINAIYDEGKKLSLEYFEKIYKKLGTRFDFYFFESETGPIGQKIVKKNLYKVFEHGDAGSVIFKGEERGLHTRVFINSEGLPTYETKELGLAQLKYKKFSHDQSIVITGNEVNDYFHVLLAVLYLISPELREKTKHVSHGMLRLPTGKMSSRTGDVVTAESLISKLSEMVMEKTAGREIKNKILVAEQTAIGAIKYSILKQFPGKDVVFDFEKSISFDGDSGAYLQYSYVRTESILRKADEEGAVGFDGGEAPEEPGELEKLLFEGLPNAVILAQKGLSPNYIASYLIALCRAWNAYYETHKILQNEHTPYRIALVQAVNVVLKNGLNLLAIPTPKQM